MKPFGLPYYIWRAQVDRKLRNVSALIVTSYLDGQFVSTVTYTSTIREV